MKTCFKCHTYLNGEKVEGVPVHGCPTCHGLWIDADYIDKLDQAFFLHLDSAEEKQPTTGYHCNRCEGSMREITIGVEGEQVDLDECTSCKGLWFDYAELTKTKKLIRGVQEVFTPKRMRKHGKKTVWKKKLSEIYHTDHPVAKESTLTRNLFIAKVYRLFLLSILTAAMGAGAGITLGLGHNLFLVLGLVCVEFGILFWVIRVRRDKSRNMLAFFTFTTFSGFTISPLLNEVIGVGLGILIPMAFGFTVVLFGTLTYFVHKTKKDFSFMGGFLSWALGVMVVSGIMGLLMPGGLNYFLYCGVGVLLFSGFVLYDTSRILLKYDVTEYVAAALDLYLDFVNIFIDILRIFYEIIIKAAEVADV